MLKRFHTLTPEGTRDYLFGDCKKRRTLERIVTDVFASRGYHEVITPGIEFFDVFSSGHFLPERMYKLQDGAGRLLVLRPDSTLPIARMVATRLKEQPVPLRLYYNQTLYKMCPSLAGKNDEERQAGIELIGADSVKSDLEVLFTAIETLKACGVERYRIELGHSAIFRLLSSLLLLDEDKTETLRQLIETKNYSSVSDVLEDVEDCPCKRALTELPRLFGGEEVIAKAQLVTGHIGINDMLTKLYSLYEGLRGVCGDRVMLDLGMINRNDYYTGVIFRVYVEGDGGTLLIGGRYDKLLEEFGSPAPAIGFSVNIDTLTRVVTDRAAPAPPDVLLFCTPEQMGEAVRRQNELIADGKICELSVFDTYDETLSYAKNRGIKTVMCIGEENV